MKHSQTRQISDRKKPTPENKPWARWKRMASTLAVCAAGAGLLASCGTHDQNYRRESSAAIVVQREPSTRQALLEWITLAEDAEAGRESRIKAKGSLVNAALDSELSPEDLDLLFGFFERNANSELWEISAGCTHAIGILGERNQRYTERSLDVIEMVVDCSYEETTNEAVGRLRDIGLSENGLRHIGRIVDLLERMFGMTLNPDIAENAVLAVVAIGEDEDIGDLDREEVVNSLFRAVRINHDIICSVWYGLEDIYSINNINPELVRRIDQESRRILWVYEGVSCSDWFSE